MRIVSWNCNGRFRDKFCEIKSLNADIYVIEECEDPAQSKQKEYQAFASNSVWVGDNKNKGLGIFARKGINIENNNWETLCLRNFVSVKINNDFDLVGVWACDPYIEEYYIYQYINYNLYNSRTIIIGDFNSNKKWDKKHSQRSHSNVVAKLEGKDLVSAYHYVMHENQGEETQYTFFMHRNREKSYHIDYCFIDKTRINNFVVDYKTDKWLKYSDHLPIVLDINK